ncbi:hypothetical protein SKAU_G00412820 [Synaphobranchus kaupii]|uniref:Reverse transcriptase domain-containing protein n=1 Tax=Synaphobranchus kaupii TaxID=118154 RepID=A0A9Q1E828_SYNKA|nr:hypothetical protein SKAU_G00412820 [Synaphobranchus kaupii]
MRQQPAERLADFLRRLEKAFTKVIQKGGLDPILRDRARVEQLLRGAVESDFMLLQLHLRDRKDKPPTFVKLLNEIREEEDHEAAHQELTPSVRLAHAADDAKVKSLEMHDLKKQIKELQATVRQLTLGGQESPHLSTEARTNPPRQRAEPKVDPDVLALQRQVTNLQSQLSVMMVTPNNAAAASKEEKAMSYRVTKATPKDGLKSLKGGAEFFCYRCGKDSYIATNCVASENSQKVIQKLLQSVRRLKHDRKGPADRPAEPIEKGCSVKRSTVRTQSASTFPQGLVGQPTLGKVIIEGHECIALMDSGSTVSIIFEGWYSQHLSHLPIQPISNLGLWGLSESSYPYRGYGAVELEFPEAGGQGVPKLVLALVCPDAKGPDQVPVIIGTNARTFSHEAKAKQVGSRLAQTWHVHEQLPTHPKPLSSTDEPVAVVKWVGPGPLTIPPGVTCPAVCHVMIKEPLGDSVLTIETPSTCVLPAGVLMPPCVLLPSHLDENSFSLVLRNESLKQKAIPKGTVIAHVLKADIVTELKRDETPSTTIDPALFDVGDSPIPETWKRRLVQKLSKRAGVFSLEEWDVGLAKGVEHDIRLIDPRPFRERVRRLAPADIDDVRRHLQELLAAGIIKESRSPYASPIVVARKKTGKICMCIDYRTLNARTIPDQYTLPRIDDALACLSGCQWFSVLDLRSGYYQISMSEEDKEKTAFICPLGFYQFERMPQGITGAPATFQRLMERAVGDMNLLQCLVYLDDLIVFGRTLEEHEKRLFKVLDRLEECGLKLSIDKCQFCQPQVKYVGHIVSEAGIATDPEKIIRCLTHAPVLAFADPTRPYVLHVDASLNGLGAVLNQEYPEGLRPVAFASRKLSQSEKNYPIHQLQFLALKWAVVDKFQDYLYGARFSVRTDNNPLTYVLSTAKLNATGHRWLAALTSYDFDILYKPGRDNVDADWLSRNAMDTEEGLRHIPHSGVKAACQRVHITQAPEYRLIDQLGASPSAIPTAYAFPMQLEISPLEQISRDEIKKAQDLDSAIGTAK